MKLATFLKEQKKKPGGLSLRGLARKARVNESTVWRAKEGKPITLESARRISTATGRPPLVKLEDLLQIELEV